MVEEERPYAERIDGVVVTVPATRLTFYLEKIRDISGREKIDITPLVLPEKPFEGIVKAIKGVLGRKEKKLGEAVGH